MLKKKFKDFKLDKFFMNASLVIPIFLSLAFIISNNLFLGLLLVISIIAEILVNRY